jgi:hypothetical protein
MEGWDDVIHYAKVDGCSETGLGPLGMDKDILPFCPMSGETSRRHGPFVCAV